MANTSNRSSPKSNTTPTESTQQTPSGWSDFGSVGSGNSGYGDTAVNPRDETGYGSLGAEAPVEQGKLSQHGG